MFRLVTGPSLTKLLSSLHTRVVRPQQDIDVPAIDAALGADMYDSVYPTRTARFGVALVPSGVLKLKNIGFAEDFRCQPCIICA